MVNSEAKAVVFYQAAMLVDPDNAIAANDLAVLLARVGRYAQARELLIRAAQQSPRAAVWHNLAVVHARLGETELAELARKNELVSGGGIDPANAQAVAAMQSVKWVDPQTFANSARPRPICRRRRRARKPATGCHACRVPAGNGPDRSLVFLGKQPAVEGGVKG